MSLPRPRKSAADVSAARRAAALARWGKLNPEERSAALAPAQDASPANKPGQRFGGRKKKPAA